MGDILEFRWSHSANKRAFGVFSGELLGEPLYVDHGVAFDVKRATAEHKGLQGLLTAKVNTTKEPLLLHLCSEGVEKCGAVQEEGYLHIDQARVKKRGLAAPHVEEVSVDGKVTLDEPSGVP